MNEITAYQLSARQHRKAAFDANFYTMHQLRKFYSTASAGFFFASLASWALSAFFIAQFFAGSEFEFMHEWRTMQFIYAGVGVLLATALTYAEIVLFNSGKVREYFLVTFATMFFGVFCETAATMQREQVAVQLKSAQSPTYQATIKAANHLATNTASSAAQLQLSYAQAALSEAKQAGDRRQVKQWQERINRLEQQISIEQANKTALLSSTLASAKTLEYDETKHQAMIRFLAETTGLSFVQSSALFAFLLISTFKLCFHYLGNMKQRSERAMNIQNGTISAHIEPSPIRQLSSHQGSAGTLPSAQNTVHIQSDDPIYRQFLDALNSQELKLSARGVREWVSKHVKGKELYEIQELGNVLCERACVDGYIERNPEATAENKKPKYMKPY